jgi:hypothetical protein
MQRWRIDATKFQKQLGELANTIAYKVQREGLPIIGSPMAVEDIYILIRQAQRSYDLFFYLNAEEHRAQPSWSAYYTIAALPAIRSMIDCLYNITAMLEDLQIKPVEFRSSGYRLALEALEEDERKYKNHPDHRWADWLAKRRESLHSLMRRDGLNVSEGSPRRGTQLLLCLLPHLFFSPMPPPAPPHEILSGKDLADPQSWLSMTASRRSKTSTEAHPSPCRIGPGHFPSAKAIQELVTARKQLRKWR